MEHMLSNDNVPDLTSSNIAGLIVGLYHSKQAVQVCVLLCQICATNYKLRVVKG